jgi:plastocyanin
MTSSYAFVPKTLTIKVGGTVVWENHSSQVDTVTDNSAFASAKAGCGNACWCEAI